MRKFFNVVNEGFDLFFPGKYKGKTYKAFVRSKGKIEFNEKLFDSPSGAAKSIVKRAANGWNFWKCRDKNGNWKRLKEFRSE